MNLLILAEIILLSFLGSTLETKNNTIVFEQNVSTDQRLETNITYIKAPTPWVKVVNN